MTEAIGLRPLAEPFARFASLLAQAEAVDRAVLPEPTAFALSTIGEGGRPAVRMLLIKQVDEQGFRFFTNYEGRKGRELADNPVAAMCFHWQPLETQVRVEGSVSRLGSAESDAYFATRARGSQLGAWASLQSRELPDEGALQRRLAEFEARFSGVEVPRPPHWGGFILVPDRMEFWFNRPNRWHERELYQREAAGWHVSQLYP